MLSSRPTEHKEGISYRHHIPTYQQSPQMIYYYQQPTQNRINMFHTRPVLTYRPYVSYYYYGQPFFQVHPYAHPYQSRTINQTQCMYNNTNKNRIQPQNIGHSEQNVETITRTSDSLDVLLEKKQRRCIKCNAIQCRTKMFYKDTKVNIFCINCYEPGMKGLHGSICHEYCNNKCDKKATWGYAGKGDVLTCRTHRKLGMINVNVTKCHFIDKETKMRCKNEATYAIKATSKIKKMSKRICCEAHCDKASMTYVKKRMNKKKRV